MNPDRPIRSTRYKNGARGQPCTFTGPTCNHDPETTVFAHLNSGAFGKGMGQKAHDVAGFDACGCCHAYVDVGHGTKPLISDAEFAWLQLRAVVLTWVNRVRRGIVVVPQDVETTFHSKPTKPRKPVEERAKIAGRSEWPKGRKIQSANTLRRKATT